MVRPSFLRLSVLAFGDLVNFSDDDLVPRLRQGAGVECPDEVVPAFVAQVSGVAGGAATCGPPGDADLLFSGTALVTCGDLEFNHSS